MVQYWLIIIAAVLVLFFAVQLLAQYQIIHKKSKTENDVIKEALENRLIYNLKKENPNKIN